MSLLRATAKAVAIAASMFGVFYGAAAFVMWDATWITGAPNWEPMARVMFLSLMVFVPCWIGSYPLIFRSR